MLISAYSLAFSVVNSAIPYRYGIESWLPAVDEIWIACDPELDDPKIFTEIGLPPG